MKRINIIITILSIGLGLSLVFNCFQKKETKELKKIKTELTEAVVKINTERDSLAIVNDSINKIFDSYVYLTDSLDAVIDGNERTISWLNGKLRQLEEDITNMVPDSVYLRLKEKYDCLDSLNIYGFTSCEVVGMYKDVQKKEILDSLNRYQEYVIEDQKYGIDLRDKAILVLKSDNEEKQNLIERLYDDMVSGEIERAGLKEDNIELEKVLKMWKLGSITTGGALLLLLIIL